MNLWGFVLTGALPVTVWGENKGDFFFRWAVPAGLSMDWDFLLHFLLQLGPDFIK